MKLARIGLYLTVGVWMLEALCAAQAPSTSFSFTLDEACKTSAGVFTLEGTLVRTLWSKERYYAPGSYTATWDGLDDSSNAAPVGIYQIKLLQHNTEYVWDGAIGNTSDEMSGATVHEGFWPIADMAFSGTKGFCVSGYDEGKYAFRSFQTNDPQHVEMAWFWVYSAQFNRVSSVAGDINDLNWRWVAADSNWVYFASSGTPNPNNPTVPNAYPGCVVACNVSDNSPAYFTQGVQIINNGANSPFPNGIYVGTQPGLSGMAVQQNGNFLAVSVAPDNKVYLLDKRAGSVITSLNVAVPGRLSFSPNGSLWVISGTSVVCYSNLNSSPAIALTLSNFGEPLDVAVQPSNPNLVLVADGGASQQLKAFDSTGAALWIYGLVGGYQANGPAVTTNKFWFSNGQGDGTFVGFVPDGSFWVGDGGNCRSLHFTASGGYLEQIMYQPHSYVASVDQNNPSRVFNQFLEFQVDYSKPLQQGWTLVNNWGANLPAVNISWNPGIYEVTTFNNGRTYCLIDNNTYGFVMSELCELTTNGLRLTGIYPAWNSNRGWISLGPDGSARRTTIGSPTWYEAVLGGFDTNNNPIWNPESMIATASGGNTDPVPRCCSFGNVRAAISTNNILISFDQTLNNGWHLGGINVGGSSWLWKASPAVGFMNGCGTYEISNDVQYAGNTLQAVDRNVVFGYHGEFFRGEGQACQNMHFYDDGLFVGQFGEATAGHSAYEGALPGSAGNGHCPNLIKTASGDYYLWINDESDHGPQRWHFANARNIREQIGVGTLGGTIALSNESYGFPTGVVGKNGNLSGQISWQTVPGATSYNIRYSLLNGGPYSILAGNTTNLSCAIGGLTNALTYYFAVTAIQGGVEGPPSEQVALNPFDTTQNVLCAGSMTEGGQFTPVIEVNSNAVALGEPSYIGAEHYTGVLNLRELDDYGYGNLQNETVGTEGYAIYDWQGAATLLLNVLGPITLTPSSGWLDIPYLERQYRLGNILTLNNGMVANSLASVGIAVNDTNFHYLTVVSPAQFNNPRAFNMWLISTNNTSAVYTVNENPGLSHVFQFLFRGNVTLTADATVTGGAGAIVQGLFFDGAPVISAATSAPAVQPIANSVTAITSSANPSLAGNVVTFTASVSGSNGTPGGMVTFYDGNNSLGSSTLSSGGQATFSTSALSAAGSPYAISAVYSGSGAFAGSTSMELEQVIEGASTTTLASSANPALAGIPVTLTATVTSSNGTPTGTVAFFAGSSSLGSAALSTSGQAALSTSALSANGSPYAITAVYSGNSTLGGSTSSVLSQVITNSNTNASPASGPSDITNGLVAWYPLAGNANDYSGNGNNGTPVGNPSFTAGVTGAANTAVSLNGSSQYISLGHPSLYNFGAGDFTVSVWFKTTTASLRQQLFSCDDLAGRQFVFDINDFAGAPAVSYLFSGNATFFAEEGGSALSANTWYLATFVKSGNKPGAMTLYLNGAPVGSSAAFGVDFPLTMQATASEVDIGHRTYSGYNDFFSGSLSGVRVYNRALAASEVSTLYSNGLSSVSTPPPATLASTTAVSSSQNPALAGNTVTFTAAVSANGGTPAGSVSFLDGTNNLGSAALNSSGQATFSTAGLAASASPHAITAVYGGNGGFAASTSGALSQIIQSASTTTLASSQNPALAGSAVTFTAAVSANGGTPAGSVSFLDGTNNLGSAALNSSGQATFSTAGLAASASPHAITAVYGGNGGFAASTSGALSQIIQSASTTTLASSQNPALAGSAVTFTAAVSANGGTPAGSVSFLDGTNNLGSAALNSSGQATFSTAGLAASASPHAITAVYGGNGGFAASTSGALSQIIQSAASLSGGSAPGATGTSVTTLFSSQNPAPASAAVTFTATVSGNGGGNVSNVPAYLTNGLVEWNRLNDNVGTQSADASGHGNSLPLIGSPSWSSNYLTFNGSSQYADAGSNQLASLDQHDKTICLWVNKLGNSQKGLVDKSFNIAGVGYGGWGFWVQANGKLMWTVNDSQPFDDCGAAALTLGSWTFVTVVWHYSAQRADFYIDGVLNSSVNNGAAAEYPSESADLEVANLRNNLSNGAYAFDGSMHDLGIYNRALSSAEVESNYLSSEFITNVGVPDLLYYRMTESAQSNPPVILADSSTHGGTPGSVFSAYALQWVTNVASVPASAIHFNGVSTYIDTSNSTLCNFTTNLFTMNVWVRPLTPGGFIMENASQTGGWYLLIGGAYQVLFGTQDGGTNAAVSTGATAAQVGAFTMVTIVRSGPTNLSIYINGIQAATTGSFISPASSLNSLIFGLDRSTSHYYDGDIWLPQVWGEALPPSAVANLYFRESAGYPWPVIPGGGIPTGTVAFFAGSSSLGSAALSTSGQAALSTSALSANGSPYAITAVYSGNSTLGGSTSSVLSQVITNSNTNASPASGPSDITNGLVAWYPLAGNANDYSGNGNNGTPVGNPSFTAGVTGAANTAVSLNGSSQYISLGHPSLYNFGAGDFTVSVWFKTTTASLRQQLFSCDDLAGRQFVFDINDFAGAPAVSYLFSGNATFFAEEGGSALSANTWYLATFVKSGNKPGAMTLYLNGAPVGSSAVFGVDFPLTMQATASEVDIGHRTYSGYNDFFSGSLSGVRVYNRALAASETTTLYRNGISSGIY